MSWFPGVLNLRRPSLSAVPERRGGWIVPAAQVAWVVLVAACSRAPAGPGAPPQAVARAGYAGSATCAKCHAMEAEKFAASDHVRAMMPPTAESIKGDFGHAVFAHLGVVSRFDKEGDAYVVTTEGADGKSTRFEVAYAFGHYPLQQYLVRFPGGRLQCLPLAYDTRPKAQGGQRWFHLYGDEKIAPGDPLHWTGPMQNWNHMCAACHATALEKGYDAATDSFRTTFAEPTLGCEACHGPGDAHAHDPSVKFERSIVDRGRQWVMDPATGIAKRQGPPPPPALVDSCARCHARADVIDERVSPTAPLDAARRPALLDRGLYHGTGEIRDEVYEWGSFTQSKMAHAGVTCADCHDPHTGKTFQQGNLLCAKCHLPEKFDVPAHHHHVAGGEGAKCVNCHMPEHTYMGVDARRDHGFRVPWPDLTVKWGTDEAPNACAACHAKEGAKWAAEAVAKWPNHDPRRTSFADALCAGRAGVPGAAALLAKLAVDGAQPGIARATALRQLAAGIQDGREVSLLAQAARAALADADPVVRAAAVSALEGFPPDEIVALGAPAMADASKLVRLAAARTLAPVEAQLPAADRAHYAAVWAEAKAAEEVNADRASSQVNLGTLELLRGRLDEADVRFVAAVARDPSGAVAWVNRADIRRMKGDDEAGEKILRDGLRLAYDKAPLHHALGLLLVRRKRMEEAQSAFAEATRLRPEITDHAVLLALVEDALGCTDQALTTVRLARLRHPNDRRLLQVLAELAGKAGKAEEAQSARELLGRWE